MSNDLYEGLYEEEDGEHYDLRKYVKISDKIGTFYDIEFSYPYKYSIFELYPDGKVLKKYVPSSVSIIADLVEAGNYDNVVKIGKPVREPYIDIILNRKSKEQFEDLTFTQYYCGIQVITNKTFNKNEKFNPYATTIAYGNKYKKEVDEEGYAIPKDEVLPIYGKAIITYIMPDYESDEILNNGYLGFIEKERRVDSYFADKVEIFLNSIEHTMSKAFQNSLEAFEYSSRAIERRTSL